MKVTDERKTRPELGDLSKGDTFIWSGELFMRTDEGVQAPKCLEVKTGNLIYIVPDTLVDPVECEVNIVR